MQKISTQVFFLLNIVLFIFLLFLIWLSLFTFSAPAAERSSLGTSGKHLDSQVNSDKTPLDLEFQIFSFNKINKLDGVVSKF